MVNNLNRLNVVTLLITISGYIFMTEDETTQYVKHLMMRIKTKNQKYTKVIFTCITLPS